MRITGTSPLNPVGPSAATAKTTASQSDYVKAANALTDSDKSLLLNGLGVAVKTDGEGNLFFTPNRPMSDEETKATIAATLQLASDRASGQLQGDVSTSYLTALLARAKDDSSKAFQDVLQRGLDFIAKGSPVKHVDTQA